MGEMISPSSPPITKLLDYALMDQAMEAVEFNVGQRVGTYEAFSRSMTKVTMAETQGATGKYVTLQEYENRADAIIQEAFPRAVAKLKEYIRDNSCEHVLPGAPVCRSCLEKEHQRIIQSTLKEAVARRPIAQGRLA